MSNAASAVSITNTGTKPFHEELRVVEPLSKKGLIIPGVTVAPGDSLWLVGTVGDAAAGLALLQADSKADGPLVDIYRRPIPQLVEEGHEPPGHGFIGRQQIGRPPGPAPRLDRIPRGRPLLGQGPGAL